MAALVVASYVAALAATLCPSYPTHSDALAALHSALRAVGAATEHARHGVVGTFTASGTLVTTARSVRAGHGSEGVSPHFPVLRERVEAALRRGADAAELAAIRDHFIYADVEAHGFGEYVEVTHALFAALLLAHVESDCAFLAPATTPRAPRGTASAPAPAPRVFRFAPDAPRYVLSASDAAQYVALLKADGSAVARAFGESVGTIHPADAPADAPAPRKRARR